MAAIRPFPSDSFCTEVLYQTSLFYQKSVLCNVINPMACVSMESSGKKVVVWIFLHAGGQGTCNGMSILRGIQDVK